MGGSKSKSDDFHSRFSRQASARYSTKRRHLVISGYQVECEEQSGYGTFGSFHIGRHRDSSQHVLARKLCLHVDSENNITALVSSGIDKARMLCHTNLLKILDYNITGDSLWIFVEIYDACNLVTYLEKNKNLRYDLRCKMLYEISLALDYLHTNSIVHGSLQPDNILLKKIGNEDVVKVTDFGLAEIYNALQKNVYPQNKSYEPPEASFEPMFHEPGDIFSLGLLFKVIHEFGPNNPTIEPISGKKLFQPAILYIFMCSSSNIKTISQFVLSI